LRAPAPAPADFHASQFVRHLRARVARWDDGWRHCLEHPRLPLLLEPLDDDHAEALLHQYRDPQIGVMSGLPPLTTVDETRRWIAKLDATPDRFDYAVMHADAGLVGFVSLQTSAPAGYFCFWAGVDYQGQGLAAQAGALLCDFARTQGIDWVFASAFNDNLRSIRALERVGFARVGLRNAAADDLRTFFGRGPVDAAPQAVADAFLDFMRREAPEMAWLDAAGHPVLMEEATS
jgi:RimJ/RimL family protein N-acetyltransferase